MTRPYASGSIDRLRSGRYRARLRVGGERRTLGVFATEHDASRELDAHLAAYAQRGEHPSAGVTLGALADRTLIRRRKDGYRSVTDDENRWVGYGAELAQLAARTLTAADLRQWLAELAARGLATQTRRNALNFVRGVLRDAVEAGWLSANVADGVAVRHHGATRETSTHLTTEEAGALVYVTLRRSPEIAMAIATGMRAGEQRAMALADVHESHLVVRFGSPGLPTKNGKLRRVPILPLAQLALDATHALYPRSRWVTPGADGPRAVLPSRHTWAAALAEAGIARRVRWHDLRHTCATLLLTGSPLLVPDGRPWSLEAVRDMLGHSSLRVTERYTVHASGTLAEQAARAALGPRLGMVGSDSLDKNREVRMGFEPTYDGFANVHELRESGHLDGLAAQARAVLAAVGSRDPFAMQRAVELSESVLDLATSRAPIAAQGGRP